MLNRALFVILLLLASPAVMATENCNDLLSSSGAKVILRLANELNPQLFPSNEESLTLEDLYLRMKAEEAHPTSAQELRPNLLVSRGRQYQIEQMSDLEIQQFYQNAIRALYARVADQWRRQEVQRLTGITPSRDVQEITGHLLDQFLRPWNLDSENLTAEEARIYFERRAWSTLPWVSLLQFLEAWMQAKSVQSTSRDFQHFWDFKSAEFNLDADLYSRVAMAFGKVGHRESCCHSRPGCVECPHNRRWLKAH